MVAEDTYLGDGLYVRMDGAGQVVLYAHNGIHPTSSVYLEPDVLAAFMAWAKKMNN